MNLIKRYIYDVTRRLPESQRADVAKELESEILEMVEFEANGKKPTKKHEYSVLMKLGSPAKLVDNYRERPRYIIGPEYYESYVLLIKTLLLVVVPIIMFIVLMQQLLTTQDSLLQTVGAVVGAGINVAIYIVFFTTLICVLNDRYGKGNIPIVGDWTPDALPELPPGQQIGRSESFFAITWSVFAVVATSLQIPAVHSMLQPHVPLFFAPEMWPYWTLTLLGLSILSVVVELIKLRVGGWTRLTVGLITVVNIASISFFLLLVTIIKPIASADFTQLVARSTGNANIAEAIQAGVVIFIVSVICIGFWEIGEGIYKYKKGGKQ